MGLYYVIYYEGLRQTTESLISVASIVSLYLCFCLQDPLVQCSQKLKEICYDVKLEIFYQGMHDLRCNVQIPKHIIAQIQSQIQDKIFSNRMEVISFHQFALTTVDILFASNVVPENLLSSSSCISGRSMGSFMRGSQKHSFPLTEMPCK